MRVVRVIGFGLLIALVAAGMPLAQSLRVVQTIPAISQASQQQQKATTQLLLPGEWPMALVGLGTGAGLGADSVPESGTEAPPVTKLVKPVSDQWDTAFQTQLAVGDLPERALPINPAPLENTSTATESELIAQTGPPPRQARGPPLSV